MRDISKWPSTSFSEPKFNQRHNVITMGVRSASRPMSHATLCVSHPLSFRFVDTIISLLFSKELGYRLTEEDSIVLHTVVSHYYDTAGIRIKYQYYSDYRNIQYQLLLFCNSWDIDLIS